MKSNQLYGSVVLCYLQQGSYTGGSQTLCLDSFNICTLCLCACMCTLYFQSFPISVHELASHHPCSKLLEHLLLLFLTQVWKIHFPKLQLLHLNQFYSHISEQHFHQSNFTYFQMKTQ